LIRIEIPGDRTLQLSQLVLDYNGTLACDGTLLPGVTARLQELAVHFQVLVLTADTFGTVAENLAGLDLQVQVLPGETNQIIAKRDAVISLGASGVVAIGNGRNDSGMLQAAALGIAVIQQEGASPVTVTAADVITTSITDALELLLYPDRLRATLRS